MSHRCRATLLDIAFWLLTTARPECWAKTGWDRPLPRQGVRGGRTRESARAKYAVIPTLRRLERRSWDHIRWPTLPLIRRRSYATSCCPCLSVLGSHRRRHANPQPGHRSWPWRSLARRCLTHQRRWWRQATRFQVRRCKRGHWRELQSVRSANAAIGSKVGRLPTMRITANPPTTAPQSTTLPKRMKCCTGNPPGKPLSVPV